MSDVDGIQVSVVIPARNATSTLEATLDALAQQSLPSGFEVIVSDNGSRDDLTGLVESHRSRFGTLRLLDASSKPGPAFARNAGADASRGLLLAFCDADDVPDVAWLESLVKASQGEFAVGGRLEYRKLNTEDQLGQAHLIQSEALPKPMAHLPFSSTANLLVPASIFRSIGGFDDQLATGEDVDFSWRLQAAGYSLVFCSDAVVHYRLRDSQGQELRKLYRYALGDVLLYKLHAEFGARRRSPLGVCRSWLSLVASLPSCALPSRRKRWLRRLTKHLGWLRGSIRHRCMYL